MFKHKVMFPEKDRLQSPHQLEDCQRRLRYLKVGLRPVQFTKIDNNTVAFRIQHVKSTAVPFPMILFEIEGTLRRWGGTGTIIENYRLKRLTARLDTWAMLFVTVSASVALLLMLPALLSFNHNFGLLMIVLFVLCGVAILPFTVWAKQNLMLDTELEINHVHQAIMRELEIDSDR